MSTETRQRPSQRGVATGPFSPPAAIDAAVAAMAREVPAALLVVRLERLAEVAQHCGSEGEVALLGVAHDTLEAEAAPWECAARLDRHHLAVLKGACAEPAAIDVARRLHRALEAGEFRWRDRTFHLGASVGIALLGGGGIPRGLVARALDACELACEMGNEGVLLGPDSPDRRAALERERGRRIHLLEII